MSGICLSAERVYYTFDGELSDIGRDWRLLSNINVASIRKYPEFELSVVAVVVVRGHIDPSAGSFARKHTPALF